VILRVARSDAGAAAGFHVRRDFSPRRRALGLACNLLRARDIEVRMGFSRPRLGFGAGLRTEHYADVEAMLGKPRSASAPIEWLEAISENYMDTGGRPLAILERVRADYPLALHGVGLSIGEARPLDRRYLANLKKLVDRVDPAIVTDHLCWTGLGRTRLYDLLPIPYTEATLAYVAEKVRIVQDTLGRQIALENPSRYVDLAASTIPEWEFLSALCEQADCGLLLDVNNVYVSACNLGFDPERYIDALPAERIAQIHLAGFTDTGTYLFDTHSAPVHDDVWRLYARTVARTGEVATMVEWDADIPSFARLGAEVDQARSIATRVRHDSTRTMPSDLARDAGRDGEADPRARAA
jgi:uncharacterized protein (UPF0276 family)